MDLVADTYRRFPFFATRSEIAERVLKGDCATLARIEAFRTLDDFRNCSDGPSALEKQ